MDKRKKIKRRIVPLKAVPHLKIGLYIPSKEIVYVSPAVCKLCEDDLNLMRKSVKLIKMPVDSNGQDMFDKVESWIVNLVERGVDIFSKEEK